MALNDRYMAASVSGDGERAKRSDGKNGGTNQSAAEEAVAKLRRDFSIYKRESEIEMEELRKKTPTSPSVVSSDMVEAAVNKYLEKNPVTIPLMDNSTVGGAKLGKHMTVSVDGHLSVDTANDFDGDNTRPITAAAVEATVGNIEILLGTI